MLLLADVLDRSEDAETRRTEDPDRFRRERIAAEAQSRRLLELVEEELMSRRELVFGEKLTEGRESVAPFTETERSLQSQLGAGTYVIDDAVVEPLRAMLRAAISGDSPELRRSYLPMLVSDVSVNDIVVVGSTAVPVAAAATGDMTSNAIVRAFDREWCPIHHPNGHSNHWEILIATAG